MSDDPIQEWLETDRNAYREMWEAGLSRAPEPVDKEEGRGSLSVKIEKILKRFRREKFAETKLPVLDHTGIVIGSIEFGSDGSFMGVITNSHFLHGLERVDSAGFTEGIKMSVSIKPPTVPWKRK